MTQIFQLLRKLRSPHGFILACALAIIAAGATTASAQEQTGIITGKVTNLQGVPLGGATVVAIDVDRQLRFSGTSDAKGIYHLVGLPIGRYKMSTTAGGYQIWEHTAFTLSFHQIARINVGMTTNCESCSADSTAPILQTDSSEMVTTLDAHVLESLPRR